MSQYMFQGKFVLQTLKLETSTITTIEHIMYRDAPLVARVAPPHQNDYIIFKRCIS